MNVFQYTANGPKKKLLLSHRVRAPTDTPILREPYHHRVTEWPIVVPWWEFIIHLCVYLCFTLGGIFQFWKNSISAGPLCECDNRISSIFGSATINGWSNNKFRRLGASQKVASARALQSAHASAYFLKIYDSFGIASCAFSRLTAINQTISFAKKKNYFSAFVSLKQKTYSKTKLLFMRTHKHAQRATRIRLVLQLLHHSALRNGVLTCNH